MTRFFKNAILAATIGMAAQSGLAEVLTVALPDLSEMSAEDADKLIAALARVNVIASNCPEYDISDGEWTLLMGTGDMLAARLGLDASSYEARYFGPAFKLLDDPDACARIGPKVRPILDDLISMGGGTGP